MAVKTIDDAKARALTAVTEAYLAITQDISQTVSASETLYLSNKATDCQACIKLWQDWASLQSKPIPGFVEKSCSSLCSSKLKNITMLQKINFNAAAFLEDASQSNFTTQVTNSINQQAQASGDSSYDNQNGDRAKQLAKISTKMYTDLTQKNVQKALQALSSSQRIGLDGPGTAVSIDLSVAEDYVSSVIANSSETIDSLNQMAATVLQLSTEISEAGNTELIVWIIRIVMLLIVLIVLLYSSSLVFQIYSLWVS